MSTCTHLPACPGCPRFGSEEAAPAALAALRAACAPFGVVPRVMYGNRRGFRHRARLAVRGRIGTPKIGVFMEGTHRVVDIPRCVIHHPLINEVALALKASLRELRVPAYSDASHAGLVRAAQIVVERASQTAQLVIVCNAATPESARPLLDSLARRLGPRLHSAWWNGNPEVTNRILGDRWWHASGPEHVVERLGGASVFFPPGAFGQNNLDLFPTLVDEIHAAVPRGAHVVELYAGTGSIGLGLVERARAVTFNELSPDSLRGLERGLGALPPETRARAHVVAGPAELGAKEIREGSVVIVDPPRKGLDPAVLAEVTARAPERLIYVSCGIDSFTRDAASLAARGLQLTAVTAYDLFPFTEHIETLAYFGRAPTGTPASPVPSEL